ncbi:hypothetical protein BASA81_012522 [Batrachochytrium salamandrivorans]|nr:hypothetical protein BASA81_012522 [Batrachochytrium salamandrivorans]
MEWVVFSVAVLVAGWWVHRRRSRPDSVFAHLRLEAAKTFTIPPNNLELMQRIQQVLDSKSPLWLASPRPVQITNRLVLSGFYSATDHQLAQLRQEFGISGVVNLAHGDVLDGQRAHRHQAAGMAYLGLAARDETGYDIMQHWDEVSKFAQSHERVLVHCMAGVNRSAALVVALVCRETQRDLVEAVRLVQTKRGPILTNQSFQSRLVTWWQRTPSQNAVFEPSRIVQPELPE